VTLEQAKKIVWNASLSLCAFTDCRQRLVVEGADAGEETPIGFVAHIAARGDRGPRGDLSLSLEERDAPSNLILLCPDHHTVVDDNPNVYTVEVLRKMKEDHEGWAIQEQQRMAAEVSYADLDAVIGVLDSKPLSLPSDSNLILIPPSEKIRRNELSEYVHHQILIGMLRSAQVGHYIRERALLDPDFPNRLRTIFVGEYRRLRDAGLRSDSLFFGLAKFATSRRAGLQGQISGLTVLVYLFETCEVFEK
jgi:hypothetical protein